MLLTINHTAVVTPPTGDGSWASYRNSVRTLDDAGQCGPRIAMTPFNPSSLPSGTSYTGTPYFALNFTVGGTAQSPRIVSGIDFGRVTVGFAASHIIFRDCQITFEDVATFEEVKNGPYYMLYPNHSFENITVEYCRFSGREGLDSFSQVYTLLTTGHSRGTTPTNGNLCKNFRFRRNVIENITGDFLRGESGMDGHIVEENWFKSVWQFEDGTRLWDSTITFALGDWCVNGEGIYKSRTNGNQGNVPPANTKDAINTHWTRETGKSHTDFMQNMAGPHTIWRGNLMDCTLLGTVVPFSGVNTFFRLTAEGTSFYHGRFDILGNVIRPGLVTGAIPSGALQYSSTNITGPQNIDGNEWAYSDPNPMSSTSGAAGKTFWGPNNVRNTGAAIPAFGSLSTYAGDPVPVFGAGDTYVPPA